MRAIAITRPGGPEVLDETTLPDPVPRPDEVVIDVAAAGVNRADILQRQGHYPPPPGAPDTPGLECSGVIAEVGSAVVGWRPGDRVAALLDGGGYAGRAIAPAALLLRVPEHLDLADAAALPEALATAWSNLVTVGRLGPGHSVLIHGGSGGVGSVATQLANALGARVITTAGSPDRAARCRTLGADVAIDHRAGDVTAAVLDATQGRGVDLILDILGAAALAANLACLATDGRLVIIGLQRGRRAQIDLGTLLAKRVSVHGTTLRARPAVQKAAIMADVAAHAWPLLTPTPDDGARLRPVVHARLPLSQAARAHALLESGEVFGKVLLIP